MKKTIVLLTIVLAILAAPVFAETGFSGSVDYNFGTDFNTFTSGTDNSTAITLDGKIGEFSSISVGIEADDDSDASASIMTITQDVTGALGVEGPVSFAYTLGRQTYSPADYSGVAGYEDAGADAEIGKSWLDDTAPGTYTTDSMLGAVLTFGIMDMVSLDVVVYPGTFYDYDDANGIGGIAAVGLLDSPLEFAANLYGTFGMVDASAYYVASKKAAFLEADDDDTDTNGNYFGFNAGVTLDSVKVGILFEAAPDQEVLTALGVFDTGMTVGNYGIAANYTWEALTAGLAFGSGFASETVYNVDGDEMTFAEASGVGINLTYALTEASNVWAAAKFPLGTADSVDFADAMGYEAGIEASLDGVTYGVGYSKASDFKAYDAELEDGNIFVSISASF